ncbi:RNA polymerase sigma factor [Microbulbifer sp. 2201CG32-9]|uniref:RNA polymerase sigma factor n=1 Tax=unclassified Microbulbifer TaxID=2619833 RepID=UPI00345BED03
MRENCERVITNWVDEYGSGLRRYFAPRVNIADVDDLVQEVFFHLHLHIRQRETKINNPQSYIFTIARNLLVSRSRYNKARRGSFHDSLECEMETPDSISPERAVIGMQEYHRAVKAIVGLPPRARTAFEFHRFEEMTYQDIAERMNISKESVKELIQRALIRIRSAMEDEVQSKKTDNHVPISALSGTAD